MRDIKAAEKKHKKTLIDPIVYNPPMQNDTIAAIGTPSGYGGIGVIRVSGPEAFLLVLPLLQRPDGRTDLPPSHLLSYGHIVDPTSI